MMEYLTSAELLTVSDLVVVFLVSKPLFILTAVVFVVVQRSRAGVGRLPAGDRQSQLVE